ncbi:HET-domain-containing protein [Apiospora rasikravindrae]|uniref:HET-domain-containing protein n=1 Tax=Apiospora rasikravindrae TaxID=990691 RepID=A0ABR1RRW6_9PEZI
MDTVHQSETPIDSIDREINHESKPRHESRDADTTERLHEHHHQQPPDKAVTEPDGSRASCSVCAILRESVVVAGAGGDGKCRETGLTLDKILEMDCPDHNDIFQRVGKHKNENINISPQDSVITFHHGRAFWPSFRLGLVKKLDIADRPGRYSLTNQWVDMEMVKHWKQQCINEHGHHCANPWMINQTKPTWLIDVRLRCLVSGKESGPYICLSYRWGQRPRYKTHEASLPELQKPGSLDRPDIKDRLAPIISHSIQLVREMNERYLWADTLCIPQDNDEAQVAEMGRMGAIYGSALLTIVALDGDGEHGLPGVPGVEPRVPSQRVFTIAGKTLIEDTINEFYNRAAGTEYGNRAWTFQEYEMSSRKLIFAHNRVHWNCTCGAWDEQCSMEVSASLRFHDSPNYPLPVTVHGLPDLRAYSVILSHYNHREMTYDSDAVRAISGILAVLSRGFKGGFLFGLPIMFFDLALCWGPAIGVEGGAHLRRRNIPSRHSGSTTTHLPSWSWVGWQGLVDCCDDEIGFSKYLAHGDPQTHPITTWYASHAPYGHKCHPIIPSWFHTRLVHCDPDQLPPGWKCEVATRDLTGSAPRRILPDGCGRYVFQHESIPDEWFWYHFPISQSDTHSHTSTPSQMPYLLGRTTRAWLDVYRRVERDSPDDTDYGFFGTRLYLEDQTGKEAGHILLHSKDNLSRFPTQYGVGTRIELVAICRRVLHEKTPPRHMFKEYYAVLWIEWENGVAYRQASGIVERSAWENHPELEEIDLVLG